MTKKRIGIVVAIELDAVLARYGGVCKITRSHGHTVREYENDDRVIFVTDSGAGEISASSAVQFLVSECGVDMIVNFGVVGGLTEEMRTASLCVVEKVIHYDYDTTGWLDLGRGRYPDHDSAYVGTSSLLLEKALAIRPDLKKVCCASADKFVNDESAKSELHEKYGADICEMEAAGIVLTCEKCGVPCLLIKSVSDSLTGGGKEFMSELGRVSALCFDVVDGIIDRMVSEDKI